MIRFYFVQRARRRFYFEDTNGERSYVWFGFTTCAVEGAGWALIFTVYPFAFALCWEYKE